MVGVKLVELFVLRMITGSNDMPRSALRPKKISAWVQPCWLMQVRSDQTAYTLSPLAAVRTVAMIGYELTLSRSISLGPNVSPWLAPPIEHPASELSSVPLKPSVTSPRHRASLGASASS